MKHFNRSLFIAHREELIIQAYEEINEIYPMQVGIIKGPVFELDKRIVVASVQTLYNRLDKISPDTFELVIVDETHTFMSRTYCATVRHFTPRLLTGWTATPKRLDGISLLNLYEEIVFQYTIENGIKEGFLSKLDAYQINTSTDISGVGRVAGDFNQRQLVEKVDTPQRNDLIVEKYMQYCKNGEQALVYCVDINHAYHLREAFIEKGIIAGTVVSDTTRCPNRSELIEQFKKGNIQVLTNVDILTTGFDYCDVGAIVMARPTQSETLFIQCLGRGTRLKSAAFIEKMKHDRCIVLDFVDNTGRLKVVNTWELEKDKPIEDRVFLPDSHREKLLEERKKRERTILIEHKADARIDLFKLPEITMWQSEKMYDIATDKQLDWIKKLGVYQEGVEYTKGMASELISNQPAYEWQVRWLGANGFDIINGASIGQYQRVKAAYDRRNKFNIEKT